MPSRSGNTLAAAITFLGLCILTTPQAARGETYQTCAGFIDSIPATITTQGVWCLRADLATNLASGNAITVATNNVIIDCNNFKLGGLSAGPATLAVGIYAGNRLNTTLRNCNIRGFQSGAFLSGGGHTVRDSRFEQNTSRGIYVAGDAFQVLSNVVIDTGGGTGNATGIQLSGDGEASRNMVNTVAAAPGSNGFAYGILHFMSNGVLRENSVSQVSGDGVGTARGISGNQSPSRVLLVDNHVSALGAGLVPGIGIRCASPITAHRGSYIAGFATATDGCIDGGGNLTP